jgi:hypothetical protein
VSDTEQPTTAGEDILSWLDAAITRFERNAHAAAEAAKGAVWDGADREVTVAGAGGDGLADGVMYGDLYEPMKAAVSLHMALNDPESVLRRCAADRKLLELHSPKDVPLEVDKICVHCSARDGSRPLVYAYPVAFPCPTIRALAEGYGWTGGAR